MLQGPTPPPITSLAAFDAEWNGEHHHDLCIQLHAGKAVILLHGAPKYKVYYVPPTYTYFSELPGSITVTTPDDPKNNGTTCIGIGTP